MGILKTAFLNVYPDLGGGEVYLERLANSLKPFLNNESVIISSFKLDSDLEWIKIDGISRKLSANIFKQFLKLIKQVNRITLENKIDIIILNGERAIYLAPFLRKPLIKIGVKHMLVDQGHVFLKTKIFRHCLKKSRFFVGISKFHIDQFKSIVGKKCQKKIRLIYNAVDEKKFLPIKKDLQKEEFVFLETATLIHRKGQIDLIKAFYKVQARYDNVKLILAGDGDIRDEIKNLITQLGLGEKVVLLGYVKDIVALLKECDVFVLPSYSEGLPLSILEAMSCSIPVIASNVAGIPEIVRDNENGYLINPGDIETLADRMSRCVNNRELCDKFGENGRKIIEESFTETQFTQKWVELLLGVSSKKSNDI